MSKNRLTFKTGQQVKNFTVLSDIPKIKNHQTYWLVSCKCEKKIWMQGSRLNKKDGFYSCADCAIAAVTRQKSPLWKGYNNISMRYFRKIKKHAKDKNRKFTITIKYISDLFDIQNSICALSGKKIQFGTANRTIETTASLDRIDSSKDYVVGNVQWVHKIINRMKHEYDEKDFIDMCVEVANYQKLKKENN